MSNEELAAKVAAARRAAREGAYAYLRGLVLESDPHDAIMQALDAQQERIQEQAGDILLYHNSLKDYDKRLADYQASFESQVLEIERLRQDNQRMIMQLNELQKYVDVDAMIIDKIDR